jgi:hypothetical protein
MVKTRGLASRDRGLFTVKRDPQFRGRRAVEMFLGDTRQFQPVETVDPIDLYQTVAEQLQVNDIPPTWKCAICNLPSVQKCQTCHVEFCFECYHENFTCLSCKDGHSYPYDIKFPKIPTIILFINHGPKNQTRYKNSEFSFNGMGILYFYLDIRSCATLRDLSRKAAEIVEVNLGIMDYRIVVVEGTYEKSEDGVLPCKWGGIQLGDWALEIEKFATALRVDKFSVKIDWVLQCYETATILKEVAIGNNIDILCFPGM